MSQRQLEFSATLLSGALLFGACSESPSDLEVAGGGTTGGARGFDAESEGAPTGGSASDCEGKKKCEATNSGGGPPGSGSTSAEGGDGGDDGSGAASSSGGGAEGSGGSSLGGGNPGLGGSADAGGGSIGEGGSASGGETGASVVCSINILQSEAAPGVGSVGVVEFETGLAGLEAASIEFGTTTDYGTTAPVDLKEPGYRTFLLGMTYNTEIHYRIRLSAGGFTCLSSDQSITTLPQLSSVAVEVVIEDFGSEATEAGFLVAGGVNVGQAYIVNLQGDLVWASHTDLWDASKVQLSPDSKFIYVRDANPAGEVTLNGGGQIQKIAIDGSSKEIIDLPTSHLDFTVLPDGDIVYVARSQSVPNCDVIMRLPVHGSEESVVLEVADAFPTALTRAGDADDCRVSALRYNSFDGSLIGSSYRMAAFLKFTLDGELKWVAGSADSSFDLGGAEWRGSWGMHLVNESRLLFVTSEIVSPTVGDGKMVALSLSLDHAAGSASLDSWSYDSEDDRPSFGDVQRLENGNTLVSFMNEVHEVNEAGELVRTFSFNQTPGYVTYRKSLYGPGPR